MKAGWTTDHFNCWKDKFDIIVISNFTEINEVYSMFATIKHGFTRYEHQIGQWKIKTKQK